MYIRLRGIKAPLKINQIKSVSYWSSCKVINVYIWEKYIIFIISIVTKHALSEKEHNGTYTLIIFFKTKFLMYKYQQWYLHVNHFLKTKFLMYKYQQWYLHVNHFFKTKFLMYKYQQWYLHLNHFFKTKFLIHKYQQWYLHINHL